MARISTAGTCSWLTPIPTSSHGSGATVKSTLPGQRSCSRSPHRTWPRWTGTRALSALRECWPETKVQRSLFHIRQNIRTHLTLRPKLEAGKELLALAKALTHITDLDEAASWTCEFASWEARWESFLKHRTYAKKNGVRPAHIGPGSFGGTPTWVCAGEGNPGRSNQIRAPLHLAHQRRRGPEHRTHHQHAGRAASTPDSKTCCARTADSAPTTPPAPSTGTSTCTPNCPKTHGSWYDPTTGNPKERTPPAPMTPQAQPSTTQRSALRTETESRKDGADDTDDTPKLYTHFGR